MLKSYYTRFLDIWLSKFLKAQPKNRKSLTIIELLVAIFIIILLFSFIVPLSFGAYKSSIQNNAFNTAQALLNKASILSEQYYNIVGIRFVPASWVVKDQNTDNKQALVLYRWEFGDTTYDSYPTENLRRLKEDIVILPANVWIAPYDKKPINYWSGNFGIFRTNPTNQNFVNADDFLILFFSGKKFTIPIKSMPLFDYTPNNTKEIFQRYNTDGITIYDRDKVLASTNSDERKMKSSQEGRIYYVSDNGELLDYK